jgi:hypothetical protein
MIGIIDIIEDAIQEFLVDNQTWSARELAEAIARELERN